MKLNKLYTFILPACIVMSFSVSAAPVCASEDSGMADKSRLVQKVSGGEIDWGTNVYYATGEGLMASPNDEPNRAKAYLKARGYARMKALANLLMVIEGTTISYQSSGRDLIAADETIRQTIEGFVKNVEMVGERRIEEAGETIVEVTVRAPLYGQSAPGTVLRERGLEIDRAHPVVAKVETPKAAKAYDLPVRGEGPFTSLVIDTRGLNVQRAMSPKIRRQDGSEVWGTVKVDYDFLQDQGIVGYVTSVKDACGNKRAGDKPLFIGAAGRAGGAFMCDAVVSSADADLITSENRKTKFLDKFNVLFIVDPR